MPSYGQGVVTRSWNVPDPDKLADTGGGGAVR